MSRITGTDAANLIEAYNSLYAPQEEVELTEEQVQEDFENWVNSLVEEGHDLSEYTWEEMYEHYLNEAPIRYSTGPTAADLQRQRAQASTRPAPAQNLRGLSIGPGGFRINNRPVQPGMSPIFQRPGQPAPARPARPAATTPTRPATPSASVSQRPAAAPAAAAKPATTATAPVATTPAAPARTFNPLMQRTFGYQTGNAPDQIAKASQGTSQTTSDAAFKKSREMVNKMRSTPTLSQSFDIFDIVKGYLIDEGYAESEEAAAVIMANMSDEWREEILDEELTGKRKTRAVKKFNSQNENPGYPDTNLAAVATMRHGSRSVKNGNSNIYPADRSDTGNRPTKRGGSGVKGKAKTGYYDGEDELDRGSGNAARRRMENK